MERPEFRADPGFVSSQGGWRAAVVGVLLSRSQAAIRRGAVRGLPVLDGVELDPVQQRAVVDRAGVRSTVPQRFPVWFPGAPQIGVGDVGERDQLDGVHLDQARTGAHRVPAAGPYLGPFPQPERHGDLPGQHVIPQLMAEEHALRLRPAHLGAKPDLGVPDFHFSRFRGRGG